MTRHFTSARHVRACAVVLATVAMAVAGPAAADWPTDPQGPQIPVCVAPANQSQVRACSDGAGGAILVWIDSRTLAAGDVYAQRIDATGQARWTTNGVIVCNDPGIQNAPRLVADGSGGAIVVWQDGPAATTDIYAQRLDAAGNRLWASRGVPVCAATGAQAGPELVADGAGGAVFAWEDRRGGTTADVYVQRLDGNGTGQWTANGVPLCVAAGDQYSIELTRDGSGGAIVSWSDLRTGANAGVYARRINGGGAAQWTTDGVAIATGTFSASTPRIVSDLAGGALLAWQDTRPGAGNYGAFAQHIDAAGVIQWTPNGVSASSETGALGDQLLAEDGSGGALLAWDIVRAGSGSDVVVQRLTPGGARLWGPSGVTAVGVLADQWADDIAPDGQGGVIVAVEDFRSGFAYDMYGQRVNAAGVRMWGDGGAPVSVLQGDQYSAVLVAQSGVSTSGAPGALFAWRDSRTDPNSLDLYIQAVDGNGGLGDLAPRIQSVQDVGPDQGGFVRLAWTASPRDVSGATEYAQYEIWREVPTTGAAASAALARRGVTSDRDEAARTGRVWLRAAAVGGGAWEWIDGTSAERLSQYSLVVATTGDSLPGSNPLTRFMVDYLEYSPSPALTWYSAPDSGYSADDLAPARPAPFAGFYNAGTTRLSWGRNREADLAGYRVYRGVTPGFVTSPATLMSSQPDTGYVDHLGPPHVYKVVAVDLHGNESPAATFVPSGTVDAPSAPLVALALAPPSPNPARGRSELRYALPEAGPVRLQLFDAAGRRVRTLVDGTAVAGEHRAAITLTDDAGRALRGGLYLIRLEAGGRSLTQRLLAIP